MAGRQAPEIEASRTVLIVDDEPLVDDEPPVLEVPAAVLEDLGCEVVTARSGGEALATLSGDQRIEVLITDLNMPEMDGYELADRAARLRPDLRILLLSGGETDGHGLPLLRKPFLEEDLARTMSQTTELC